MKSLLGTLAILMSVSAQAAPNLQQIREALHSANCVTALSSAVDVLTAFSDENKEVVLHNLGVYKKVVDQIITNLDSGRSVASEISFINELIAKHEQTKAGEAVSWCVKSHANFNVPAAELRDQALNAQAIILDLEKAAM